MYTIRIYDANGGCVVEGNDRKAAVATARALFPTEQLVGEEDTPDGRTVGFVVSKVNW